MSLRPVLKPLPKRRFKKSPHTQNISIKSDISTASSFSKEDDAEYNLTSEEIIVRSDLPYYKRLQVEFWTRFTKKRNQDTENNWDNQLFSMSEEITAIKKEVKKIDEETNTAKIYADIYKQNVLLSLFLDNLLEILDSKLILELVKSLEKICHKIDLGDVDFNKEDISKFEEFFTKFSPLTTDLKIKVLPEYNILCDKFKILVETLKKVKKIQSEVKKYVAENNDFLIQALSIVLSNNSILNNSESGLGVCLFDIQTKLRMNSETEVTYQCNVDFCAS